MLREITLFGEKYKDKEAIKLLQFYEPLALERDPRGYLVGFSGGKDSLVLKEIFKEAGVRHFCVYNVTGLDPPELVYFKRKMFTQYRLDGVPCYDIMYERNIVKLMEAHGVPPTRIVRYCCEELKERRIPEFQNCVLSFGVRKYESKNRMAKRDEMEVGRKLFQFDNDEKRREFETCYATGRGEIRINPLAYWTDIDIWDFIHDRKLEYCKLYDCGFKRLGCIGCPMSGKRRLFEFNRYPAFERIWRKGFELMWQKKKNKTGEKKEYRLNFDSVDDWWDWWMELTPKTDTTSPNQLSLFTSFE